jgi:hypothetical protein
MGLCYQAWFILTGREHIMDMLHRNEKNKTVPSTALKSILLKFVLCQEINGIFLDF